MLRQHKLCKVISTCYSDDFVEERKIIRESVMNKFRNWCESKGVKVHYAEIVWGSKKNPTNSDRPIGKIDHSISLSDLCELESIQRNDEFAIFLNISSSTLGWLPIRNTEPNRRYRNNALRDSFCLSERDLNALSLTYGSKSSQTENSVFLLRNDQFLLNITRGERSFFPEDNLVSEGCKISYCPGTYVIPYSYEDVNYDVERDDIHVELSPQFSEQVFRTIKKVAEGNLNQFGRCYSQFSSMNKEMQNYVSLKLSTDLVEEAIDGNSFKKIWSYLTENKESQKSPFLLHGGEKSGKSTLLLNILKKLRNTLVEDCEILSPWKESDLFVHFIDGLSIPTSTCIKTFLLRMIEQLDLLEAGTVLPKDIASLSYVCYKAFYKYSSKSRIVIVDGLDKFEKNVSTRLVSWLPKKLPNNVRIIVSCSTNSPQYKTLLERDENIEQSQVDKLTDIAQQKLAVQLMLKRNWRLLPQQTDELIVTNQKANPTWLDIACKLLADVESRKEQYELIENLPSDLEGVLELLIESLENSYGGMLVQTILCLLKISFSGLSEKELNGLVRASANYRLPSLYEEKGDKEESEKHEKETPAENIFKNIDLKNVELVLAALRPFLSLSKHSFHFLESPCLKRVVQRRYLKLGSDVDSYEESELMHQFWHSMLANYFLTTPLHRKLEEYIPHLIKLKDRTHLCDVLSDWDIFDMSSVDTHSDFVRYWRELGTSKDLVSVYLDRLPKLSEFGTTEENDLNLTRRIKLSRLFLSRGAYEEALELAAESLHLETTMYGARSEFMAELNSVMTDIKDENLKLNDFLQPSQITLLKETVQYTNAAIKYLSSMNGEDHILHLAVMLMKLAFDMESWEGCGGDDTINPATASKIGKELLEVATAVFIKLNNINCLAEAYMTKGVLADKTTSDQLFFYDEALHLTKQFLGEQHPLNARLHTNMAIIFEDNGNYVRAYKFFLEWAKISEQVYGPSHPKAQRAFKVLREKRYQQVAKLLEQQQQDNQRQITDEYINNEVRLIDDPVEDTDETDELHNRLQTLMNVLSQFRYCPSDSQNPPASLESMRNRLMSIHEDIENLQANLPSENSTNIPALRMIASRLSELQEAHRLNIETERRLEYLREQQEQLQNERTRLQQHREVLFQQRITLRQLHNNLEVLQTEADDTYNTLQNLEENPPAQHTETSQEQVQLVVTPESEEVIEVATTGSTISEIERIKNRIDSLVGRLRNLNVNMSEDEEAGQDELQEEATSFLSQSDSVSSTPTVGTAAAVDEDGGATAASQTRAKDVCERAKELREKMNAMASIREKDIEETKASIENISLRIEEDESRILFLTERFPDLEEGSEVHEEATLRKTRIQNNIELLKTKKELVSKLQNERETLLADSEEIERSTSQLEGLNQILSDQEFLSETLDGLNNPEETDDG